MAKKIILSVYDSKAEAYIEPIVVLNAAVGLRSFLYACNQEGHDFHSYAADYTLFELGTWDENTGIFDTYPAPLPVMNGLQARSTSEGEAPPRPTAVGDLTPVGDILDHHATQTRAGNQK